MIIPSSFICTCFVLSGLSDWLFLVFLSPLVFFSLLLVLLSELVGVFGSWLLVSAVDFLDSTPGVCWCPILDLPSFFSNKDFFLSSGVSGVDGSELQTDFLFLSFLPGRARRWIINPRMQNILV